MPHDGLKALRFAYSFSRKKMVHANFQLLYDCNFTCKICDFWKDSYRGSPRVSAADVAVIAKKLKPYAPMIISLGGGEPLLHPELEEIVRILAKDHFPVMICNGWFVTAENARNLFRAGLYEVSVSLDYASPEKHDAQRGRKGAFEKAVNALRLLHENRTNPHQRVHMISVIMEDNVDEVAPLIEMCKEMGITYLVTFYSSYRGRKENRSSPAEISMKLLDIRKKYPDFLSLPDFIRRYGESSSDTGIRPCYAGRNLFHIDASGNVSRCIDRLDNPVGNFLTDDAPTIFAGLEAQFLKNDCGACWTSCRGSVESLMYGENRLKNLLAYREMTRAVPLAGSTIS